jgi:hypothetical protein
MFVVRKSKLNSAFFYVQYVKTGFWIFSLPSLVALSEGHAWFMQHDLSGFPYAHSDLAYYWYF